jgi:hypothetical protein
MTLPGGSSADRAKNWRRFLPRPSYANVVSTIALFLALGGVAFASNVLPALSVGSKQLKPNAVRTGKIANRSITRVKIRKGAIRYAHLNPQLVKKLAARRGPAGPRGQRGAEGPRGEVGPAGAPGADGSVGATGATGAIGPQGDTGVTGPAGVPGVPGHDGVNGPTGATGVTGLIGPIGMDGPTGATGATGPAGTGDLTLIESVNPFSGITPGASFSIWADCPSGMTVVSGGFAGGPGAMQAYQSYPASTDISGTPLDRWRVAVYNPSTISQSGNVSAYALCQD